MLPIHLACYKTKNASDRNNLQHIYFRKGLAIASDAHLMIALPAKRLLGNAFDPKEDFAIHAEAWRNGKMDKAVFIDRDGDVFTSRDKNGNVIGQCKLVKLETADFKMPDFTQVWASYSASDLGPSFAINPAFITRIQQATDCEHMVFRRGENPERALVIQCFSFGCGPADDPQDVCAYVLVMPLKIAKLQSGEEGDLNGRWDVFNGFFPKLNFKVDAEYVPMLDGETPHDIPGFISTEPVQIVNTDVDDLL